MFHYFPKYQFCIKFRMCSHLQLYHKIYCNYSKQLINRIFKIKKQKPLIKYGWTTLQTLKKMVLLTHLSRRNKTMTFRNKEYTADTITRITTHDLYACLENKQNYAEVLDIVKNNYSIMEHFSYYVYQVESSLEKSSIQSSNIKTTDNSVLKAKLNNARTEHNKISNAMITNDTPYLLLNYGCLENAKERLLQLEYFLNYKQEKPL